MSFVQVALCLLLVFGALQAEIPDYIKVCKRDNKDLSECIKDSVNALRENLVAGIPELGVPRLEPLNLDDLNIQTGLNLNLTEVFIAGAGKYELRELNAEIEKNRFAVLINIPELNMKGRHSVDMQLLTIPLKGRGPFTAHITDFNVAAKLKGRLIDDEGVKRLKFDPFEVQVSIGGKREIHIEGLFEDNPTLKMAGDAVIADNADVFFDELRPAIEKSMSSTLTRLANKITTHFTYDELFPQ